MATKDRFLTCQRLFRTTPSDAMSVEKIGTCSAQYMCHTSEIQTGWSPHFERPFLNVETVQSIIAGAGTPELLMGARWRKVQPSIRKCVFWTMLMRPVNALCFRVSASAVTFRFRKVKPLPLSAPSRALQTAENTSF
jgi:hypothetical protein